MKSRLVRVIVGCAVLVALPSLASVVVAQSIEEMTRSAPLVVRGRIGQVQAAIDETGGRIWTRAEVAVTETIKGHSAATVLVRQPGGEVGNFGQRVEGTAAFTPGEEAIFFLETVPDEAGVYTVYALAAGKVNLEKSKVGEVRAVRHLEGLAFYSLKAKGGPTVVPVGDREDLGTPTTFLARLRKAAGGAR